ncbi:MAG: N-acetylmuramoyl-L-alanine amidase AmiB, partial [Serratia symbiotica]|nr:N-acetylmuramoyl-L-alanine amidase AmiB [Serratia symbiotica]
MAERQNGGVHILVFTLVAEGGANATLVRKAAVAAPVTISQPQPMRLAPSGANPFTNKPSMVVGITTGVT